LSTSGPAGRKLGATVLAGCMVLVVLLVTDPAATEIGERGARVAPERPSTITFEPPAPPVAPPTAADRPSTGIRGTVVNEAGERVEGARVALLQDERSIGDRNVLLESGRLALTDDLGGFTLARPYDPLPPGTVLSVRHPGYKAHVRRVEEVPADPLHVVLEKGRVIAGRVLLLDRETPAAGVRIVARGVGAPYASSRADCVPPAVAAFQETTADENGTFELEGLSDGWHQVDVVAPGLAVVPARIVPFGTEVMLAGARGVVARTGDTSVRIHVAPVGVVAVRIVDGATGSALPYAFVTFSPQHDLQLLHRSPASMNSGIVLAAGRTYSIDGADLASGVEARFVLGRSFPLAEDLRCRVNVQWRGYQKRAVDLPVVPLGTSEDVVPHDIVLTPARETGSVRFFLHDRHGTPVRCAFKLVMHPLQGPPADHAFPVRWSDGKSEPLAFPVGAYEVRVATGATWTPIEPQEVRVEAGKRRKVYLELKDYGGFALNVVDEAGTAVNDFGLSIGLGHQPIEVGVREDQRGFAVKGLPVLVPGLGQAWRGQAVGYPEGPVTIEVIRHGYLPRRIHTEARAGKIRTIEVELVADPEATWRMR